MDEKGRNRPGVARRGFMFGGVLAAGGVFVDMRFIEPRWLRVKVRDIALPRNRPEKPVRILHLSDMHASRSKDVAFVSKAIDLGLEHEPDLVCLTGDLITGRIDDVETYARILRKLSDYCPCYACMGNHDGGSWSGPRGGYATKVEMLNMLADANVEVLLNRSVRTRVNGVDVEFVGLGDLWAGETSPKRAFPREEARETPRVVLSHNPDSKTLIRKYDWDLMLCGHTHGGQLSLPLIGTPFAPVRDHRYVYGLNEWEGRLIHTTRGIGCLHNVRFNCRPEVSVLDVLPVVE